MKFSMLSKVLGKKIEAEKIRRKDGSYSERGLWDNIRDKQKRGEKPRKPGEKGAPTKKAFEKSKPAKSSAEQAKPKFGLKREHRPYACKDCGHIKDIPTNHTDDVSEHCHNCSWKGVGYGDTGHNIPGMSGIFRRFEYVGN